jgi:hypothetical protein
MADLWIIIAPMKMSPNSFAPARRADAASAQELP